MSAHSPAARLDRNLDEFEDLVEVLALRKCKEEKAESVSQARAKGQ